MIVLRELPGLHRSPDAPRPDASLQQGPQQLLARILVRRRYDAKPGSDLGVLSQRGPFAGLADQMADIPILKHNSPEGLSSAPHAGHEHVARVHRPEVGRRQLYMLRRWRLAVPRLLRQFGKRTPRFFDVDRAGHCASPPWPDSISRSNRCRNCAYACFTGIFSR